MSGAAIPVVDLQVNGFQGVDFSSPTLEMGDIERATQALVRRSTVGFLATIITSARSTYERNLDLFARAMQRPSMRGKLLGVHLEGPFLNPAPGAIGVHPVEHVRPADGDLLNRLIEVGQGALKLLTVAADVPAIIPIIENACRRGIRVSLGHHLATEEQIRAASQAGASATTHLGNGLPDQIHRHHNTLWPSLAEDRLAAMVIADGHHLPSAFLKVVARAKGRSRWMVVSDAAPLAGLPPGRYRWGADDVLLEPSGRIYAPARSCFAGSACTLGDCVDYLQQQGFSLADCKVAAFDTPLSFLGLSPRSLSS